MVNNIPFLIYSLLNTGNYVSLLTIPKPQSHSTRTCWSLPKNSSELSRAFKNSASITTLRQAPVEPSDAPLSVQLKENPRTTSRKIFPCHFPACSVSVSNWKSARPSCWPVKMPEGCVCACLRKGGSTGFSIRTLGISLFFVFLLLDNPQKSEKVSVQLIYLVAIQSRLSPQNLI